MLAKATDAEKPCSLENVALLSTLRTHIGMTKYCVDEGELSRFDEETRLALPFKMAVVVQNVFADANTIATTLTSEWIAKAGALLSRLHELAPPWQPHKDKLLSEEADLGDQLMASTTFPETAAISESLEEMAKAMKVLNSDGAGVAVAPGVLNT